MSDSIADARAFGSVRRVRVVVVEDDDGLRVALVRLLRARGFDTRAFASGEAALADGDLEASDCLVVDLNLPAMSGFCLVDRLRERGLAVPAVATTARDDPGVLTEVSRHGFECCLVKPFLGRELVALLEAIVERSPRAARRDDG